MRVSDFSVNIPEGRESGSGYVELAHGSQYTLRLHSHTARRCDADVSIDGKPVGCFRIDCYGSLTLERPTNDTGKFTFYATDSTQGRAVGASGIDAESRGLVQVRFRPERERARPQQILRGLQSGEEKTSGGVRCSDVPQASLGEYRTRGLSSGATGLSGKSSQSFTTVAGLDYDPAAEVTITLRLLAVTEPADPRPLTPATPQANPVPAPLRD